MRREGGLDDRDRLEHMLRGGRDALTIAAGRARATSTTTCCFSTPYTDPSNSTRTRRPCHPEGA